MKKKHNSMLNLGLNLFLYVSLKFLRIHKYHEINLNFNF